MSKTIHIITLFPNLFQTFFHCGIVKRIFQEKGFHINLVDLKLYSPHNYKGVDDSPYGGGPGRVLRADVLQRAFDEGVLEAYRTHRDKVHVILPSPRGKVFHREKAYHLGECYFTNPAKGLVFICGRYEGIDERFIANYVNEEISLGDFVLSGGEIATMAVIESSLRFVPGILGNPLSAKEDSFEDGYLKGPVYTRPAVFEGLEVPKVLLSGNHRLVEEHRKKEKLRATKTYRPDMQKNLVMKRP